MEGGGEFRDDFGMLGSYESLFCLKNSGSLNFTNFQIDR